MVNPINLAKDTPCTLPGIEMLRSEAVVDNPFSFLISALAPNIDN